MSGKHSENKKNEVGCLFPKKDIKMEMCFSNSDIANLAEFLKKFSLIYKILKNIIFFFIIRFKSCCPNFADERRILSKKHYLAEFSFWEGLLKVNVLGQYVFIDSYVVVHLFSKCALRACTAQHLQVYLSRGHGNSCYVEEGK